MNEEPNDKVKELFDEWCSRLDNKEDMELLGGVFHAFNAYKELQAAFLVFHRIELEDHMEWDESESTLTVTNGTRKFELIKGRGR